MKNIKNVRIKVSMPAMAILLLANIFAIGYDQTAQMVDERAEVTT